MVQCEVAYATATRQWILPVRLPDPATVQQAILASGILTHCPDVDLTQQKVGIFSVITALDAIVHDGDRVEIYRPLLIDPMQKRRQCAVTKSKNKTSVSGK